MKRIVITGATGLLGWHSHARLHAANCAARFKGEAAPYEIVALNRAAFNDPECLRAAVSGADAILHFAGINRGSEDEVETGNQAIAERLTRACRKTRSAPHIVYANSTHARNDTPYGRGKRRAGELLSNAVPAFTDVMLPHIFGEGARPFYNNVTATLIHQILADEVPSVDPDGKVQLLHAGAAVQMAINAVENATMGEIVPESRPMAVSTLLARLKDLHDLYVANIFPDLSDPFDCSLFNCYRAATYPDGWPRPLRLNKDERGTLFESVKGGGGGQTFMSTTKPGVTRGDHFHLAKVERFLVIKGEAVIRIRKVLTNDVWEYRVSGEIPAPVDMPVLHTHSIENVGSDDLLTLFWTNDLFNPKAPDTYADKVI